MKTIIRRLWVAVLLALMTALALAGCSSPLQSPSTTGVSVLDQPTTSSVATTTATSSFDTTTTTSGLPAVLPRSAQMLKVPILMYHYVDTTPPKVGPYAKGLTVRASDFQAQMDYLAANGYHTVTLDQIYVAMAQGVGLPTKPVALTFDDGGMDNYTVAFPILKAHKFVATFFVITAYVGSSKCFNWDQAREMQEAGMAIESHTVHHPDLTTLDSSQLAREMADSRRTIKSILGTDADVVAYPSGQANALVERAAEAAGYRMAVGTQPGDRLRPDLVFKWPRMRMSPGIGIRTFASMVKS